MTEKDNRKLKKTILGLEQEKFDELFLTHHAMLYHYGKSFTANAQVIEDSIQELFIHLYEKEIDLNHIKNLKAYLITSLRRRILEKRQQKSTLIISDKITDFQFSVEDLLIEREEKGQKSKLLATHLNSLPWRQKEAVYLKFFNNLSAKEIAEIMGITTQVVSNTVYKAIKKLKEIGVKTVMIPIFKTLLFLNF